MKKEDFLKQNCNIYRVEEDQSGTDRENTPLVSVIVPIYNTQNYLPRCLESILCQTYTNMEIILVNDGSTDDSLSVCEEYARKDSRIQIISQPNQGIIAAKKAGICLCRGEYVMFVDSDDWIEPELLGAMVRAILENDCSLVCTNVYRDYESGRTIKFRNGIPAGTYEADRIAKDLFYYKDTDQYGILPYSVAKLYPMDMLKEVLGNISGGIRYAEDKAIVFGFVFKDIRVCFTDDMYYHYIIREGSVCRSENPDYLVELTAIYKYVKAIFDRHEEREHLLRQLGKWLLVETNYAINELLGLTRPGEVLNPEPYRLDPSVFFAQKKKVILYGAGNVGADYRKQLADCANFELCGWVDREYQKHREKGLDVQPVEYILKAEFDMILVAIRKQSVFQKVRKELVGMGIPENAVIWGRPYGAPCENES